jgi:cell division protein FtsN
LPVAFNDTPEIETPRPQNNRLLVAAAVVIVAGAAAWFAVRGFLRSDPADSSVTAAAPPPVERQQPPAAAPAAPPPANPPVSDVQPPTPAPATSAPAVPAATSLNAPAGSVALQAQAPAETPGPFEIVVASFRTMTRASQVAAELTALGQPNRQRTTDGWEQVLAGPFPTRDAAAAAQERLGLAGYTGTQIVPAPR